MFLKRSDEAKLWKTEIDKTCPVAQSPFLVDNVRLYAALLQLLSSVNLSRWDLSPAAEMWSSVSSVRFPCTAHRERERESERAREKERERLRPQHTDSPTALRCSPDGSHNNNGLRAARGSRRRRKRRREEGRERGGVRFCYPPASPPPPDTHNPPILLQSWQIKPKTLCLSHLSTAL